MDGLKLNKLALKSLAVIAISLIATFGVAQSASALAQGSFKCVAHDQDFNDRWGNHNFYDYLGGTYSAGHAYYSFHHWTYPFDNGIMSCRAS
ncbi:MAG: hypothetical protein ACOH1J_09175 [Microbacteriaceae bacterium]